MLSNKYRQMTQLENHHCVTTNLKYDSDNQMFAKSTGWKLLGKKIFTHTWSHSRNNALMKKGSVTFIIIKSDGCHLDLYSSLLSSVGRLASHSLIRCTGKYNVVIWLEGKPEKTDKEKCYKSRGTLRGIFSGFYKNCSAVNSWWAIQNTAQM